MRVLFFGTSAFAVPNLERLLQDGSHQVRCLTQPDQPQGRGLAASPSLVKSAALRRGLVVDEAEELRVVLPELSAFKPELAVVVAYGQLIPKALLDLPTLGCLGVHPSLLPRYRGASPIARAILDGEQETGVTIFRLCERLDAGEIFLQERTPIGMDETAEALSNRLAVLGAEVLMRAVAALEAGTATWYAQDERLATYAPKLTKQDGWIDWSQTAEAIDRRIRASIPWPGAQTNWRGQSLKIWRAQARPVPGQPQGDSHPGQVVAASSDGVVVATGSGSLVLEEFQLAGRKRLAVREFLLGHRMEVGDMLGGSEQSKASRQ